MRKYTPNIRLQKSYSDITSITNYKDSDKIRNIEPIRAHKPQPWRWNKILKVFTHLWSWGLNPLAQIAGNLDRIAPGNQLTRTVFSVAFPGRPTDSRWEM